MTARRKQDDGGRRFLMLQGPHGPFFRQLGRLLQSAGAEVHRVGFNKGDEVFWGRSGYIPYTGELAEWPHDCRRLFDEHRITDLILVNHNFQLLKIQNSRIF